MAPPIAHAVPGDGTFPGSALPALVYKAAVDLPRRDPPSGFETLFARHGWTGSWRNGLYAFHHYHSSAHEVLGISAGAARVQLGGPAGVTLDLAAGDVVVIPAGVAHKNLGASGDFRVVGAYPSGSAPDLCTGKRGERPAADEAIARLAVPIDPVEGPAGALETLWNRLR
jgi:uncharacterized protein YjlB